MCRQILHGSRPLGRVLAEIGRLETRRVITRLFRHIRSNQTIQAPDRDYVPKILHIIELLYIYLSFSCFVTSVSCDVSGEHCRLGRRYHRFGPFGAVVCTGEWPIEESELTSTAGSHFEKHAICQTTLGTSLHEEERGRNRGTRPTTAPTARWPESLASRTVHRRDRQRSRSTVPSLILWPLVAVRKHY